MSAAEFGEWYALYLREPWGEAAADLRAGIVASTIANVNRSAKERKEPYVPSDFMRGNPWELPSKEEEANPEEFFEQIKHGD